MRASVGDLLVVRSHKVGVSGRQAVVLAVEGEDGGPPYLVRWEDTDQEGLFFPGADSEVEHLPAVGG